MQTFVTVWNHLHRVSEEGGIKFKKSSCHSNKQTGWYYGNTSSQCNSLSKPFVLLILSRYSSILSDVSLTKDLLVSFYRSLSHSAPTFFVNGQVFFGARFSIFIQESYLVITVPCILPHHVTIGRDRRLHNRHHRHRVDQVLRFITRCMFTGSTLVSSSGSDDTSSYSSEEFDSCFGELRRDDFVRFRLSRNLKTNFPFSSNM